MKKFVFVLMFIMIGSLVVSAQKSVEDSIVSLEKSLWEAWSKKDAKTFDSNLADDGAFLSAWGIASKKQTLTDVSSHDCVLKSYNFNNTKVTIIAKNTALMTYEATQDGTCGGQAIPSKVYVSSVFVKRKGKWLGVNHAEIAALGK